MLWLDPRREWRELLERAASEGTFELWADSSEHELSLRDRFVAAPAARRIVWRPCGRDELTWFKVFESRADFVWTASLMETLQEYGVEIPRNREVEVCSLLPQYAIARFDQPRSDWDEVVDGRPEDVLVDDHRVLEALAGETGQFERLRQDGRFEIFARRVTREFGLPEPTGRDEDSWRTAATAVLLCTEAADRTPHDPPHEPERIVPSGLCRDRALRLLKSWLENVHFLGSFERLGPKADATTGLRAWGVGLADPPRSQASRAVEEACFARLVEQLSRLEDIDALCRELERSAGAISDRVAGFWGTTATSGIPWRALAGLAEIAGVIAESSGVAFGD